MKKEFIGKNIKRIKLNFEGNANINITKSDSNIFVAKIDYTNDKLIFTDNQTDEFYNLKIENPDKKKEVESFIENLNNIHSFKDILSTLINISKDSKNTTEILKIDIEIPVKLESFELKLNNGLVKFDYINSEVFEIKGNNLNINLIKNVIIKTGKIKINNANIEILLNNKLKEMNIKLNKGNLIFYREKNSHIGVVCKGNNVIEEGNLETTNNLVNCKLNSGIVKIIEKGE